MEGVRRLFWGVILPCEFNKFEFHPIYSHMRHIVFNKHSKRIDISDLKTKNYNLILSHFKLNTYLYIILFAGFKKK